MVLKINNKKQTLVMIFKKLLFGINFQKACYSNMSLIFSKKLFSAAVGPS
jgi:hypothetical protein